MSARPGTVDDGAVRIAFVNLQGNFDPQDSHLASHPDFGGQLVYVREVARALGRMGHQADIVTRHIVDPDWPEFAGEADTYPGHPNVRILRVPCGPPGFLPKEELWPYLGEWAKGVARRYAEEGSWPDLWTGHYADGGLSATLLVETSGIVSTFTAHALGVWKLDLLLREAEEDPAEELRAADARYNFGSRIQAERAAMARSTTIITNSDAERRERYGHPAYRDAVNIEEGARFAVIPPGVNFEVFDPDTGARGRTRSEPEYTPPTNATSPRTGGICRP